MSVIINEVKIPWNGDIETKRGNHPDVIVLHHSENTGASVLDINEWHKSNGWMGIGYNYYIRKDGSIWRGRPEWAIGSHSPAVNTHSIGICCEGNFMNETSMTEAQMNSVVALCQDIRGRYGNLAVTPHKQWTSTQCPGTYFPLDQIRNKVNSGNVTEVKTNAVPQTPTIVDGTNAVIGNDFFYVRDENGNIIPGRRVDVGDRVKIIDISKSKGLIELWYPTPLGVRHGFIKNVLANIGYFNFNSHTVIKACDVFDKNSGADIGGLDAGERVTLLEDLGDKANIAYNTPNGLLTKSGIVNKANIQK